MAEEASVHKRRTDPEHEDHSKERHPISWQELAPRWLLVVTIAVLVFAMGWLIADNRNLSDDRLARIERYQSDTRWGLLAQYGTEIALLRGDVRAQRERLEKIEGMADDVRKLRVMFEAEAAKRKRNVNFYGMP